MGKTNLVTVLAVTVLQILIGYFWYSPHFFGDVMTGHGVDYTQTDVMSVVLLLLSSYGLSYILDLMIKTMGVKDVGGALRVGTIVGTFAIGLPTITLLNLVGFSKIMLLVVFCHLVLLSILGSIVIVKIKKL